jgi:hypothetical protein
MCQAAFDGRLEDIKRCVCVCVCVRVLPLLRIREEERACGRVNWVSPCRMH